MVVTGAWFSAVIAVWSLLKEIYSLVITVLGLNDGIIGGTAIYDFGAFLVGLRWFRFQFLVNWCEIVWLMGCFKFNMEACLITHWVLKLFCLRFILFQCVCAWYSGSGLYQWFCLWYFGVVTLHCRSSMLSATSWEYGQFIRCTAICLRLELRWYFLYSVVWFHRQSYF